MSDATLGDRDRVEWACEVMHDAYEAAATREGGETQTASRKPWVDVPEANKATMRTAVGALLAALPSPAEYVRGLADDETLMYRMGVIQWDIVGVHSDSLRAEVVRQARDDVLALAAALTERAARG